MSKQTKKVRETWKQTLVTSLSAHIGGQHREGDERAVLVCLMNVKKFRLGDRVRVTVERIERPQRKGRRG